jgi:hypothetical protein
VPKSDGGGEYINGLMGDFLKSHGVHRQVTALYIPQQSGVAERMEPYFAGRCQVDETCCWPLSRFLGRSYFHTGLYFNLHIYLSSTMWKSPEEKWSSHKPDLI